MNYQHPKHGELGVSIFFWLVVGCAALAALSWAMGWNTEAGDGSTPGEISCPTIPTIQADMIR